MIENIMMFITVAKAVTTWNDFIERRRKAACPGRNVSLPNERCT